MIVCCPTCRTRYRHAWSETDRDARARCSRCETSFPLGRRAYALGTVEPASVVAPSAAHAAPMPIGVDDPGLQSRIERAERERNGGGPVVPMTWAVVAADEPGDPPDEALEIPELAPPKTEAEAATPGRALSSAVLTLAGTGLGAALGYLFADRIPLDLPMPYAVGACALTGLLIVASSLRWMHNRS